MDVDGKFVAPEATLKSLVLISTSSRPVTVARGASSATGAQLAVHGVSGLAGVGKTVGLNAPGHDVDIKNHFVDGVLYMSVGATATAGHLTRELCKIMRVSGASTSTEEVQSSKSLADAVSNAAVWFHGRRILFLIDDNWPTTTNPEGYLPDLIGLLQGPQTVALQYLHAISRLHLRGDPMLILGLAILSGRYRSPFS